MKEVKQSSLMEIQDVINASRLVSDNPNASISDLRFHLNAVIYELETMLIKKAANEALRGIAEKYMKDNEK